MSTFTNTQSIASFKSANGIVDLKIMATPDGKPYFKTDNGMDGKMSTAAFEEIKSGNLSDVRISTFDPEDGNNTFFMIHLVSTQEGHTKIMSI